ncbi:AMP-binding protein [Nakamurella sp. YIM 132087]|uniref:AMP-binding protein n=1 Tax=Nakamurella alba TaxID=2665158 RepID=A0A7K1FRU0_9ACTN|nr:AMP-binding protein [Nakamurella alba]MTD15953.1 AMP-binding protein [Nakamurella alba]
MTDFLDADRGHLATPALAARLQVSLGEALPLSARRHPDKRCFVFPDGSHLTFAEVNSRVNRLADALSAGGVGKGDRLAVFALDSHRYVEVVLAALKLGAVYVPLNYRLTRPEIEVLIGRSAPVMLFHDDRYSELLAGMAEQFPSLRTVVDFETDYEDLLGTGRDVEPPVVCTDTDTIGLAFTSGTTGLPKGVVQSQRMMKAIIQGHIADYDLRIDDFRYVAAPTFHITGICALLAGVSYGFPSLIIPQFSAKELVPILARDELTAMFLVPTMISMLFQQPGVAELSFTNMRTIYYGASPMSPTLLRKAMDIFGCGFINAFGAGTEAGLQAVMSVQEHQRAAAGETELLGSIGKPAHGVALRLVDDEMNDVPDGEVGEIATRSDMLMDGYLDMPEETARAFRDGWFRAGDMAYRAPNGFLYLYGRKKDMIIRGGENIYPSEIETVLAEHPAIVQSAVIGVPDEHWGEIVRAFVTVREGQSVTADELREHCNGRLGRYKVPAEFLVVDALPTNASGKILKRELRTWDMS